jgi:hypothetical protein
MRTGVLAAFALLMVAAGEPTPTPSLPTVNVDDMMGLYPQQTVFVASAEKVSAITLLNHFVRYEIPTQGPAEVSADPGAHWLYVLDDSGRRLRIFDVASGNQRAAMDGITDVAPGGHALGATLDGAVLVLKSNGAQAWVAAYAPESPPTVVMLAQSCSDRLLTSGLRIAAVCSASGQITLDSGTVESALPNLIGAAMGFDGAIYVVSNDGRLATVASRSATLDEIPWPTTWSGTVVPDAVAVEQSGTRIVLAQTTGDDAWLRIMTTSDPSQYRSFRLAGTPNGGLQALWPFAYYAFGSSIRHVDMNNGLLEIMAEIGATATPRAVVNG